MLNFCPRLSFTARLRFIAATFVLQPCLPPFAVAAEPVERPNIVFIIADDLRFDLLGCNGHPAARTPHIDQLAREGANFSSFFATTPLCSPSRASFLTGLYPHAHRIINNDDQALAVRSHRLMTFPRLLRERADYETAYIGKWHMGFDDSRRPGFDHWISFKGQGQFIDPVVNVNGVQKQTRGYLTDLITEWSCDFLQRDFDRPFCIVISHEAVHYPFLPAERHEGWFDEVAVELPPVDPQALAGKRALRRPLDQSADPAWFGLVDASPEPGEPRRGRGEDFASYVRDQLRCLAAVDEGVGRIVELLRQRGLLNRTMIVFTSDQGYTHGEFGLQSGKRWPYDPCLRVPFIVRYPPLVRAGTTIDALALNIDVAPTLYELAGTESYAPLHGRSMVGPLRDPQPDWRDAFLCEYFVEKVTPRCPRYFSVRTKDWKYVRYPQLAGMDELYHLEPDPGEVHNLIDAPEYSSVLQRLQQRLDELNRETRNPFGM